MQKLFILLIFWFFSIAQASQASTVVPGFYLVKASDEQSISCNIPGVKSVAKTAAAGVYRVEMDTTSLPITGVAYLSSQDGVSIVEPLRIYRLLDNQPKPFFIPNDPLVTQQWHLGKIAVPAAWDISIGTANIVVAVIDTGVEPGHSDLINSLWHNPGEIPGNGIDDDHNGYIDDVIGWDFVDLPSDPEINAILAAYGTANVEDYYGQDGDPRDVVGHGTHVAGLIAGTVNNNAGIAGVAPGVKIMALKAGFRTNSGGFFTSETILNSISYARHNGARIISMSFGDTVDDQLIHQELEAAYRQGIVLIAAAGNDNNDQPNYPAAIPFVISVGATDSVDNRTTFSSFGPWVDIAAPGQNIISTISNVNDKLPKQILSNITDNKYAVLSGTSMAAPIVAGVAALMLSVDPRLSPDAVDYILKRTADKLSSESNLGAGRVNALRALTSLTVTSSSQEQSRIIQKLFVTPNPVRKKTIDSVQIKLIINSPLAEISCDIYSQSGQRVWNRTQSSSGTSYMQVMDWNGASNDGEILPIGIYYLLVKVCDTKGNSDVSKTKILLVD